MNVVLSRKVESVEVQLFDRCLFFFANWIGSLRSYQWVPKCLQVAYTYLVGSGSRNKLSDLAFYNIYFLSLDRIAYYQCISIIKCVCKFGEPTNYLPF